MDLLPLLGRERLHVLFLLSSTCNYVVSLPFGTWDNYSGTPCVFYIIVLFRGLRIGSATAIESLALEQCSKSTDRSGISSAVNRGH